MKKLLFILTVLVLFSCKKEELEVPVKDNVSFIDGDDFLFITQSGGSFKRFTLSKVQLEWRAILETYSGEELVLTTTYECSVTFVANRYEMKMCKVNGNADLNYVFTISNNSIVHYVTNDTNYDFIIARITEPKQL